jgi:hypothetical protein
MAEFKDGGKTSYQSKPDVLYWWCAEVKPRSLFNLDCFVVQMREEASLTLRLPGNVWICLQDFGLPPRNQATGTTQKRGETLAGCRCLDLQLTGT